MPKSNYFNQSLIRTQGLFVWCWIFWLHLLVKYYINFTLKFLSETHTWNKWKMESPERMGQRYQSVELKDYKNCVKSSSFYGKITESYPMSLRIVDKSIYIHMNFFFYQFLVMIFCRPVSILDVTDWFLVWKWYSWVKIGFCGENYTFYIKINFDQNRTVRSSCVFNEILFETRIYLLTKSLELFDN